MQYEFKDWQERERVKRQRYEAAMTVKRAADTVQHREEN